MRRPAAVALAAIAMAAAAAAAVVAPAPTVAGERAADHVPPPGQWALVPGSTFLGSGAEVDEATAARLGIAGRRGPHVVVSADHGAAWDDSARCLYAMGGGRRDWGGNEVYRLCLDDMHWRRITEPSALAATAGGCPVPGDGPVSGKSYDGLVMADGRLHAFLTSGFCPKGDGLTIDTAWALDPARPDAGWRPLPGAPRRFAAALTARNPRTGGIIVIGAADDVLAEADPRATVPPPEGRLGKGIKVTRGDVCTEAGDDVYCLSRGRTLFVVRFGPDMRAAGLERLGDVALGGLGEAPCMAWHPGRRRLVMMTGVRSVYEVDPASLAVTRWPNPEGPAPAEDNTRVVSKCAYDRTLDAFVLVRDPRGDAALYRLPPPGTVQEEPESGPGYVRGLPVPPPKKG